VELGIDPPTAQSRQAFLPDLAGKLPTVRLYAGECVWCGLDPGSSKDLETFRQIIGERAHFWNLEFQGDTAAPKIGRVVIDSPWRGDIKTAQRLLADICSRWPGIPKLRFLTTCGAFIRFPWPASVPKQEDNCFPAPEAIAILEEEAREWCEKLLEQSLVRKLSRIADYVTVGVDTFKSKISSTQNYISEPHVELVCFVDLRSGEFHFTGKSYPTPKQAKGLVRVSNLDSHFMNLGSDSVLVLGCHDLTIFNPRSDAVAKGWRAKVKTEFKRTAKARQPRIVLHHPHTTTKVRTWSAAWHGLKKTLPSIDVYAGSGAYSRKDVGWSGRDSLDKVLETTKSDRVLDILVHMGAR